VEINVCKAENGRCERAQGASKYKKRTHILANAGGKDKSKYRKKASEGTLTSCERKRMDTSGHEKKASEPGLLTLWRPHRGKSGNGKKASESGHSRTEEGRGRGSVRKAKERGRAGGTHFLESEGGGASQDNERKEASG